MLVMNKQKQYIALKVEDTIDFYVNLGKYLDDKYYEIVKEDNHRYFNSFVVMIKIDEIQKIKVERGCYILIEKGSSNVKYITDQAFKNDYIELKEEN